MGSRRRQCRARRNACARGVCILASWRDDELRRTPTEPGDRLNSLQLLMWAGRDATGPEQPPIPALSPIANPDRPACGGRSASRTVSLDVFEEFMPDRNVLLDPWNSLNAQLVLLEQITEELAVDEFDWLSTVSSCFLACILAKGARGN